VLEREAADADDPVLVGAAVLKKMSVAGYMAKDSDELRMPRLGDRERDGLGIRMRGAVMQGERSVESRLREDATRYSPDGNGWELPARDATEVACPYGKRLERYRDARDYDPVLRGHCRLDE
jgi:hypothetical protein